MIIWLLFEVLLVIVESVNYRRCRSIRTKVVKCENDNLQGIPLNFPSNTEQITIKDDDLSGGNELPVFPTLHNLKKLTLTNVNIKVIPRLAFANLRNLQTLSIYNDYIEEIHPEAFHRLNNLQQLRIMSSSITQLPEYMVRHSSKLTKLYLNNNLITRINRNTFRPLNKLNQVSLMHNLISRIDYGAFEGIDSASRYPKVYLGYNELQAIPQELTEKNWIHVTIHDNPIVCDCNLIIPDTFRDRKAECASPVSFRGTRLTTFIGEAIDCTVECLLPSIVNGYADHDGPIEPGVSLKIWCYPGYDLNVMPRIVCQDDGTFGDVEIPDCIQVREEPEELDDGSILLISNQFARYPTFVESTCPTGSVLKTCRCMEYYCQGVVITDNSCKVYAAPLYPTKSYLTCLKLDMIADHYTYELREDVEHAAACRQTHSLTTCTNYIPLVNNVGNHGEVETDNTGVCRVNCGQTECEMFIRCLIIIERASCEPFSIHAAVVTLEGSEMTATTKFVQGDVVTITCHDGYELFSDDDSNTVECVEGDNYTPQFLPECYEIVPECAWERIENVTAYPGWIVEEGLSATFSCASGFEGQQVVVHCEEEGLFERNPNITCEEIEPIPANCTVGAILNAFLAFDNGSSVLDFTIMEGVSVTVTCQDGFEPVEPVPLTCLPTGALDKDLPTCTEIEIGQGCSVPRLRNGEVAGFAAGSAIDPGTTITFACHDEYELVDTQFQTIECVSNQYYQPNEKPRCRKQEVRCEVPILLNGYYHGYKPQEFILKNERLIPGCFATYTLTGPEVLVCTNQLFGGEYNTCEKPDLDCTIPIIENGRVLHEGSPFETWTTFPVVCESGYWTPYNTITCVEAPATYDPLAVPRCELPVYGCVKVAFPFMKPLDEEPRRGQTVTIECIAGYTLYGTDSLACGQSFQYLGTLPQCLPNSDCEVPAIENGGTDVDLSHVDNGTSIHIVCDSDHSVYGDAHTTCLGGDWTGLISPECRPTQDMDPDCDLPFTDHGFYYAAGVINPGSGLELACDGGYVVEEGSATMVMCVTRNEFEPATLPQCVRLQVTECAAYSLQNGTADPSTRVLIGQSVTLSCDPGHQISGSETVHCGTDGRYDRQSFCEKETPKCSVPFIEHGQVVPETPIESGARFYVECDDGWDLDGDDTILCEEGGETQPPAEYHPACIEIPAPCEVPEDVPNGYIIMTNMNAREETFPVRASTYYICNTGYEPLSTEVICLGNDMWRPPIPECRWTGATCPTLEIDNGTITVLRQKVPGLVQPWDRFELICDEGFEKSSQGEIRCSDTGEYNIMPSCTQLTDDCDTPNIANGTVNGPLPLETDDRFSVECNEGFELVGTKFLMCWKGDQYSDHLPTCQMINQNATECRTLHIQNAQIIGSPLTGYYVSVICDEGYSIMGDSKLQCLSTGKYDKQSPQCVKKDTSGELLCGQRSFSTDSTDIDSSLHDFGDPKIYGGSDAVPGEYPWNVLIEFTRGKFCGGSIINSNWVLTAGHCLLKNFYTKCDNRPGDQQKPCKLMNPSDVITIIAGVHNREEDADTWQRRTATKLLVHPYFTSQPRFIDYDVGLIQVSEPFEFNRVVNRVCLPKQGINNLIANQYLFVSGWGKTNNTLTADVLQKITVPYVDRGVCNSNISYEGIITETMFCAGYKTGKLDACQGDSGGPLVFLGSNGTFVQGGIVSWGRDCARVNYYGVYTNLAYFYNWIMGHIVTN